ncbi:helix-turn-helix transcriptional regulator [Frisingicoccus sp.]|uniref:helix-turn-helix transcriptional regulator n=1 Tax=Frisingicoccus sp. TaxID=1918627 RepID=UPI0025BD7966|nr:helix-turn-helix transcriptional regulator [Frisingicoccus sp.]
MKERLKQLRKTLDITQQEFADRIGIKRNSYANYETGRNTPIDAIILSICREFNVNEEWIRNGTGEMFVEIDKENQLMMWAGSVLKDESDSFKRRFVNMLMELDESDWESLEKMCLLLNKKD